MISDWDGMGKKVRWEAKEGINKSSSDEAVCHVWGSMALYKGSGRVASQPEPNMGKWKVDWERMKPHSYFPPSAVSLFEQIQKQAASS